MQELANPADIRAKLNGSAPKLITASVPLTGTSNIDILKALIEAPEHIRHAQNLLDKADRNYKRRHTALTIQAYATPIFPGKKPEDGLRFASNESERETAVMSLTLNDAELEAWAGQREDYLRNLRYEQNLFEAAKLIAQLTIATAK